MQALDLDGLVVGERYDFETSDGTVYENSVYLGPLDDADGYGIKWGSFGALVFIATHEHGAVRPCQTTGSAVE